jgi:hypothetical protein
MCSASALRPKADICSALGHVCYGPIADSCTAANLQQAVAGPARSGHYRQACEYRLTEQRSSRTGRPRRCRGDRSGCNRHRARARDAMSSTTAARQYPARLCGRYGPPWPGLGCCSSSCGRCDLRRAGTRDPPGWSRSTRRDDSARSPRLE